METISPSRNATRTARPAILGSCALGRLALTVSLIGGFAGCQLGTRQPLNLPPGLGSPHSSSFKPDTGKPDTQTVRGQTPDSNSNGTFGNSANARPQQPTVTNPATNNRYTGQGVFGSGAPTNAGSPYNAPPNYSGATYSIGATNSTGVPNNTAPAFTNAPPSTNSPFALPSSQSSAQTGLVSTPAGVQPPLYGTQPSQPQSTQQSFMQPQAGTVYQQPGLQTQPGYAQPSYGQPAYPQPSVQQPAFDPYAATQAPPYNQGAVGGTVAPPTGFPNNQVPGQYNAGQYNAGQYGAGQYGAGQAGGGQYGAGQFGYDATVAPGAAGGYATSPENALAPGVYPNANDSLVGTQPFTPYQPRERVAPIDVWVQEARTGRIMVGGSVNSDLGLSGQLTIDERNFDITRVPSSWDDLWSGKAFRGRGQNFRAELMPGTLVQRYTVNWSERNFLDSPYSLSVGGFYFTRQFRDWTEQRLGGRVALGYEINKDLTISTELRMEDVKLFDPRKLGVAQLDRALGSNDLYTGRVRLAHDTRDSPFMSTEGHLLELIYDQVFGEFDYPRGMINYNRYFLMHERPDQTGRHTLANTWKLGFSGADTPIFENFFAGGYSTLRGFRFRGASPVENDVQVGGRFMALGSLEYVFPLTADEMLRGVAFCDYGTIEQDFAIRGKNIRVAPGLGLRVSIPALGPAPLAFDFAYPVQKADGDQTQVFSFFMGLTR